MNQLSRTKFINEISMNVDVFKATLFATEITPEFDPEMLHLEQLKHCHRDFVEGKHPMYHNKAKLLLLWLSYQVTMSTEERVRVFEVVLYYWLLSSKRSGLIDKTSPIVQRMKDDIQKTFVTISSGDLRSRLLSLGMDPRRNLQTDISLLGSGYKGKIVEWNSLNY